MAQITAIVTTPWTLLAAVWAAPVVTPWTALAAIWSTGGAYTPPAPPTGGTGVGPSTTAGVVVGPANAYNFVRTLEVRDLRDNSLLPVERVTIATDRDSLFWTLRATGANALFAQLSAGEQPPRLRATLDGVAFDFVIESVNRTRQHPGAEVSVEGRSLSCAAGAPYQGEQAWAVEGDTTAAQIAAAANLYTELQVDWQLFDWPVPAGVFSIVSTPLGVVRRVAEAAGAVVLSQRTGFGVSVRPRYPLMPNEWDAAAPELELSLAAVDRESFRVDDQPPYDGVVVSGQQQGVIGLVRLAGTTGAHQAPMVTDVLITDLIAARQRGQAVLGRSGKQRTHTLTLPLPRVGGVGVVPDPGWLVRVPESPPWLGLVTAVQIEAQLPTALLTLTLERHTEQISGTVTEPPVEGVLAFDGPIPDLEVNTGAAVDIDLSGYWSGGSAPLAFSLRSGALPAWLELDEVSGHLVGTAPGSPETGAVAAVRATDAIDSTADSNEFGISVVATSAEVLLIRSRFNGSNGQTTSIADEGSAGGSWAVTGGAALASATAYSGGTSLRLPAGGEAELTPATTLVIPANTAITVEFRLRLASLGSGGEGAVAVFAGLNTSFGGLALNVLKEPGGDYSLVVTEDPDLVLLPIAAATWVHVCLSMDSAGSLLHALGGVVEDQGLSSDVSASRTVESFVLQVVSGSDTEALVDNVRVRSGFAYTANFTPDAEI